MVINSQMHWQTKIWQNNRNIYANDKDIQITKSLYNETQAKEQIPQKAMDQRKKQVKEKAMLKVKKF